MMLNKGKLILIIAAVALILIIVVASGSGTKKAIPAEIKICTVKSDVGVVSVRVSNQNTGNSITKIAADLPYSFNFTAGDTLQFNVTTLPTHTFNAWVFNTGTFDDHNPLTMRPSENVAMTAITLQKPNQ